MTPAEPTERRHAAADITIAVAFIVTSCALTAGTTLIAKMLGPVAAGDQALHPLQVTAGRFFFAFLVMLPVAVWKRPDFAGTAWSTHIGRTLCAWAGITCLFAAAAQMRLADATAISFLNPIVAMILSIPFLGEKVGPWRWAGAAVAFAGAVFIAQPGTAAFQPIALVALLAATFLGCEIIFIKRLTDREPMLRILILSNGLGAFVSLVAASFVWRWPSQEQWLMLAAIGGIMATVQVLFLQAIRRGDASFITPFLYTTLIFAGFYDFMTFGVTPSAAGWFGGGLVVAGALIVAWRERIRRKALFAAGP